MTNYEFLLCEYLIGTFLKISFLFGLGYRELIQ